MLRQPSSPCNSFAFAQGLPCPSCFLPTAGLKPAHIPLELPVPRHSSYDDVRGLEPGVPGSVQANPGGSRWSRFLHLLEACDAIAEPEPATALGDVGKVDLAATQVVLTLHGILTTTSREIPWAGTEISRSEGCVSVCYCNRIPHPGNL